jgi:hypothetical protein
MHSVHFEQLLAALFAAAAAVEPIVSYLSLAAAVISYWLPDCLWKIEADASWLQLYHSMQPMNYWIRRMYLNWSSHAPHF